MSEEKREGRPNGRNILIDREGVLRDIAEIERIPDCDGWAEEKNVKEVLDWISGPEAQKLRETGGSAYIRQIYGTGGSNRWYVYLNGEVMLGQAYDTTLAKQKGFRILEEVQGLQTT